MDEQKGVAALSKRAQNVVARLGGLQRMLDFHLNGRSFLDLPLSGRKTDLELTALCRQLLVVGGNGYDSSADKKKGFAVGDVGGAMREYYSAKKLMSEQVQNYLSLLERNFMVVLNDSQKELFLVSHFNPVFKFVRKVGFTVRDCEELNSLQKRMSVYLSFEEVVVEPPPAAVSMGAVLGNAFAFDFLFKRKLTEDEIDYLFNEGKYCFERIIAAFVISSKLANKLRLVANHYFFDKLRTVNEIALLCDCSTQSVRNSVELLTEKLVPRVVAELLNVAGFEMTDLHVPNGCNFFESRLFGDVGFEGKCWEPNYRLGYYALRNAYADTYILSDDLIDEVLEQNRVFKYDRGYVFISKHFAERVKLGELLVFLESEIYAFESVLFEYDLRVLIERFYREHDYSVEKENIDELYKLIEKVKVAEIAIDYAEIKRMERRETEGKIFEIVERHLMQTNRAERTEVLIQLMQGHGINIEREELLRKLNRMKSTFAKMGYGAWGLRSWVASVSLNGSIREIAKQLLKEKESPIHISELLGMIGSYRDISKHSIISNLKNEENNTFKFFNCAFIGLSNKNYDSYWYEIPKFVAVKLQSVRRQANLNYEEKIRLLVSFGYPEIHCRYMMAFKDNQVDLLEGD